MDFTLLWREAENGQRHVKAEVSDFIAIKHTFPLIPTGPKTIPGLKPLQQFGQSLREDLRGTAHPNGRSSSEGPPSEWSCGSCQVPNRSEAAFCTACGTPRDR